MAYTSADNDTEALIGTGALISLTGDLSMLAKGKGSSTSVVDGTAAGDEAAFGAAVSIIDANDRVVADTKRSIGADGAVTIKAENSATSKAFATASAKGASTGTQFQEPFHPRGRYPARRSRHVGRLPGPDRKRHADDAGGDVIKAGGLGIEARLDHGNRSPAAEWQYADR